MCPFRIASIVLSTVAVACSASRPGVEDDNVVRELIASQFASQLGVWEPTARGDVSASDVRLQSGPVVAGVTVVRGIPPRDHWPAYIVVARGESLCRAGGFTAPQLECVVRLMRASNPQVTPPEIARHLTVIADPNGGLRMFSVREARAPDERAVTDAWHERRPANWPRDTVFTGPAGNAVVRITTLSQQTRSYEQAWHAIAYDFQFNARGALMAWARRVSESFTPD